MKFFNKLFDKQKKSDEEMQAEKQQIKMEMDELFVHNFIDKGGRFLYCTSKEDITENLVGILDENNWTNITCLDTENLSEYTDTLSVEVNTDCSKKTPILSSCEYLISNSGSIMLSSNQIKDQKLPNLSDDFIVFAKTSQFVKNMGEGLRGIKSNFKTNIPTNICAIKNYAPDRDVDNFLSSENSNTKNLYLLLFEDL